MMMKGLMPMWYVAMKFPKLQVQAVELDEQWAGQVQTNLDHRQLPATVSHVNIGPTEAFAFPVTNTSLCRLERWRVWQIYQGHYTLAKNCTAKDVSTVSRRDQWPSFSEQILTRRPKGGLWDVILVDSRFRVACALKSFLHLHLSAAEHQRPLRGVVLVHDFVERRPYQEILRFGELQQRSFNLAVFIPRPLQHLEELRQAIRRYEYLPP